MIDYVFLELYGSAMPIKITNTDHMDVDQILLAIEDGWTIFYKGTSVQASFFTSIYWYGGKYFISLHRQDTGGEPDNTSKEEYTLEQFRSAVTELIQIIRERGRAVKILW